MSKLKYLILSTIFLFPNFARAEEYVPNLTDTKPLDGDETLFGMIAPFLLNAITFLLSIAGFLAVGYIIYGGYILVSSAGNEQQVQTGKKALTNAIIGFIIALAGVVIVQTIKVWLKVDQQ
ncbi:MAG: pilin [Patescibacteria group bacterium]